MFLAFISLAFTSARCQALSTGWASVSNEIAPLPINFPNSNTGNKSARSVMMAGFISMGAGSAMFVGGIALALSSYSPNDNNANEKGHIGAGLLVAGGIAFIGGTAMAIGGGAAWHHSKKKSRYTIVSPKMNEVGLAYNLNR